MLPNVTIIGLGLMGGSLAKALRSQHLAAKITGCGSSLPTLQHAKQSGIIDDYHEDAVLAVENSTVVALCTPLHTYPALLTRIKRHLSPDTVITDVGSVKEWVVKMAAENLLPGQLPYFVPGHPVAGSEQSGFGASTGNLFMGKHVILTPLPVTRPEALRIIQELWQSCGAATETLSPQSHDQIYAEVSHLPQLVAFCYAQIKDSMLSSDSAGSALYQAFTRLGKSNPAMWQDIFIHNAASLRAAAEKFCSILEGLCSSPETAPARLTAAREKRMNLDNISSPVDNILLPLPALIACALLETVSHIRYAGTGFRDMTSPLLTSFQGIGDRNKLSALCAELNKKVKEMSGQTPGE